MSAPLADAFAERTVGDGNYPMMGTMGVYVLRELDLVFRRRYDAPIHPFLGGLERYV